MVATTMRVFAGFNPVHHEFLHRLAELSADETCPYEFFQSVADGGRTWARCRLVTNFRKMRVQFPALKWLYFHDDDMGESADELVAGLLRLLSHRMPVVGALYTTKGENPHWVANFLHEVDMQPGGILQVYEVGLGGLLCHFQIWDAIEAVFPALLYTDRDTGEKHIGFFQEVVLERVPYSEDFFFCWLLRHTTVCEPTHDEPLRTRTGIGLYVDTGVRLKHRGADGVCHPDRWPPVPVDCLPDCLPVAH